MKQQVYLAHHFWQGGANATWNPPLFPYPQVEQTLKGSYPLLAQERPPWRKYGNMAVFFDYRPEKDIYGRDIVPISFAFVPDCRHPEDIQAIVAAGLRQAPTNQLKMTVDLPSASTPRRRRLWPVAVGAAVCLALVGIWLVFGKSPNTPSHPGELSQPTVASHSASEGMPSAGSVRPFDNRASHEPVVPEVAVASPPEPPSPLCGDARVKNSLGRCGARYFEDFCSGSLPAGENYEAWKTRMQLPVCSRTELLSSSSNREKLDPELQRILDHGTR